MVQRTTQCTFPTAMEHVSPGTSAQDSFRSQDDNDVQMVQIDNTIPDGLTLDQKRKRTDSLGPIDGGTDEKAIIRLLGQRNASQRKKIREAYQQLYNKSLIDDLNSETLRRGFTVTSLTFPFLLPLTLGVTKWLELMLNFLALLLKAVILWTYDPPERDARLANEALKSRRKNLKELQVIVEIACASSPDHLIAVRQEYCSLFNCSLEEDITKNVSLPVQKILVSMVSSYRYDKEVVDNSIANLEAAKLRESIRTKKLDRDDLVFILSTRNIYQLGACFECYKQNYGYSIDQVVKDSVVGFGTDENSLTRAIVMRAEIDMMKVRGEYNIMYKTSLDYAVEDDTSGDYRDFLMTLLGANI
nr:Annexin D3 [Ipomoea batatas]